MVTATKSTLLLQVQRWSWLLCVMHPYMCVRACVCLCCPAVCDLGFYGTSTCTACPDGRTTAAINSQTDAACGEGAWTTTG